MKVIITSTVAPSVKGWFADLVKAGSTGSTYVMALQGDVRKWDSWSEIKRVNPLVKVSQEFADTLKEERDEARRDPRKKGAFLSYRLNVPSGDESQMLLTLEAWLEVCKRPVPEREGLPIVGLDMGSSRAWSSAVAIFPTGRCEAVACCPGIPDIQTQEARDVQPAGAYQKLIDQGLLRPADGLRVQPAKLLVDCIKEMWGPVRGFVADRFRLPELADCINGTPLSSRVTRWSESSEDIRAVRALAKDGPLAVPAYYRPLFETSLERTEVKCDDAGSMRIIKSSLNTSRDDVSQALCLAAGAHVRNVKANQGGRYLGVC